MGRGRKVIRRFRRAVVVAAALALNLGWGNSSTVAAAPAVAPAPHVNRLPIHRGHPRVIQHASQVATPAGGRVQERMRSAPTTAAPPLGAAWTSLGPQPINNLVGGQYGPAAGRITALAGSNPYLWAGTADGGVWRSADYGFSWVPLSDDQVTLAIGAIAFDWPTQTLYAGTGEGNRCEDCLPSQGILKGKWDNTSNTISWSLVGQSTFGDGATYFTGIALNGSTVVAATTRGLFVSTDAGATWPPLASPTVPGRFDSLTQDRATASRFWATSTTSCSSSPGPGTIGYLDTYPGGTWHARWIGPSPAPVTRIGIGAGPGAAQIGTSGPFSTIYAALAACDSASPPFANGQLEEILKSVDGGATWTTLSSPSLTDYMGVPNSNVGQGWYDNVVAVDPANPDYAVFAGISMLVTTDGGLSFTDIANPYTGGPVHPDFHAVQFTRSSTPGNIDNEFVTGNDGGVYLHDYSGVWENRSSGLSITQFYAGTSPDLRHLAGGSQDNGTAGNPQGAASAPWVSLLDGDGGWTSMIPGQSTMFGEVPGLDIYQFDYSGTGAVNEVAPCSSPYNVDPSCNDPTEFIAPFVMDPTSTSAGSARLYAGSNRVYRTTTGGLPAGGTTSTGAWSAISGDLTAGRVGTPARDDAIHTMAIGSKDFAGTLITGSRFGKVWMTTGAATATPTWLDVTANLPPWSEAAYTGNAWITGLALEPLHGKEAWVTIGSLNGGRVWDTSDITNIATNPWTDISATLPANLVVDSIAIDPLLPQNVYIGTDSGALVCATCGANGGTVVAGSWVPLGTGLPNVRVDAITMTQNDAHIIAWTHGRGAFKLLRPYATPAATLDPPSVDFGTQPFASTSPTAIVRVTSSGNGPLTLSSFATSGDFRLDQGGVTKPCTAGILAQDDYCNLGVTFTPSATGSRAGSLAVYDNAVDSPQTAPLSGTGVVAWQSLGGGITGAPGASASGNHADVVVRGAGNNAPWHRSFDGRTWSGWEGLPGGMTAAPASVSSTGGRIDLFVRGGDNGLWWNSFNGSAWAGWTSKGGVMGSAPSATSPSAGLINVYVRGVNGQLWSQQLNTNTNRWSGWSQPDHGVGVFNSAPSAVSWGSGRVDIFVRGMDKQLWHFNVGANSWEALGGVLASGPGASTWGANRLDVFVQATDGHLWHTRWNGATWAWTDESALHGGIITAEPAAESRLSGSIDVFARGTDGALYYLTISGS